MNIIAFILITLISFNAQAEITHSYQNCYGAEVCHSCGDNCYYTYSGATLNVYGPTEKNDDGTYKESAKIGQNAFFNPSLVGSFYAESPGVSSTTIPATVTDVKISGNVTSIENSAFANSKTLQTITLPESLEYIGNYAFWGTGITDLYIPKNVTLFGGDVFRYSALKNVEFAEDSKIQSIAGIRSFLLATNLEKVILPDGLKTITEHTFSGDGKLTSINIPDSVTTILGSAFDGVKLTELTTNADNLIRFLCRGNFKEGTDITINCTGTASCENTLQDWLKEKYGEDEANWPSWHSRVTFNNQIRIKNADGSYTVYELGKFVGFEGKRIYTIDEATALVKGNKNTFSIRYR